MNNFYIPTKGRAEYMVTSKYLSKMGVDHHLVVEEQEVDAYNKAIKTMGLKAKTIVLPPHYKEDYEKCDRFGLEKSTGPGPARNFAWDHSKKAGFDWHWVMDDNIKSFRRFNKNEKVRTTNKNFFTAMEDFTQRYSNVHMAGPNYTMFVMRKDKRPPFIANTRIYSCNYIYNHSPFRWRGRYNEDTILSLDMLKAGYCTIQFNVFLQEKMPTQVLKGGNTDEFYHKEGKLRKGDRYSDMGTFNKSQMLVDVHPDVSSLKFRFGRIHHMVDYSPFRKNKLLKKENYKKPTDTEYGMKLVHKVGD